MEAGRASLVTLGETDRRDENCAGDLDQKNDDQDENEAVRHFGRDSGPDTTRQSQAPTSPVQKPRRATYRFAPRLTRWRMALSME